MAGAPVRTEVCITVDVEPSVGGAFDPAKGREPLLHPLVAGTINGRSEALGFLIRTLQDTGLAATFFVETLHTSYFDEGEMGGYVEGLMSQGHDPQLHVHPAWFSFRNGKAVASSRVSDHCADHPVEQLVEFLEAGKRQFERWTGRAPVAMRTGSFSTSRAAFQAMSRVGLKASSSICVGHSPPREPELQLPSGAHLIDGIWEYPITSFRDCGPVGRSRFRGLQVTACAQWEIRALLEDANRNGYPYVIIVTHPFEFIKKDGPRYAKLTANRINQSRFRWLCAYLAKNPDRFPVVTMSELAQRPPLKLNRHVPELASAAIPSLLRSAQNVLNDHIWAL
ncbi:MAG: hypothetical protein U1E87_10575 [Alphaproteobacteria bacterium]